MQFVEAGVQPFMPTTDTASNLRAQSDAMKNQVAAIWQAQRDLTGISTARMQMFGFIGSTGGQ
jgi:hypothetical protein